MSARPKLVVDNTKQTQQRLFTAQILRCRGQLAEDRKRNLRRHYSNLDNAAAGCVRFMMGCGQVGDVCELYHELTGMQLGTVRLNAKGKLVINWVWE